MTNYDGYFIAGIWKNVSEASDIAVNALTKISLGCANPERIAAEAILGIREVMQKDGCDGHC